jgi:hypothetical protein
VLIYSASRPHPHEDVNGDAWISHEVNGVARIAVIDGLGHGGIAAEAAQAAIEALNSCPTLPPAEAIHLCHKALHHTRGAAISIASIDVRHKAVRFAGIGNVECRLLGEEREQRLVPFRGIVGGRIPTVREFQLPLDREWALLLHTDGVSARFDLSQPDLAVKELAHLPEELLARWGRLTDDATVVLACSE